MTASGPDPEVMAAVEQRRNCVVFFDMVLGGGEGSSSAANSSSAGLGRIKLELFVKDVSVCWVVGDGWSVVPGWNTEHPLCVGYIGSSFGTRYLLFLTVLNAS